MTSTVPYLTPPIPPGQPSDTATDRNGERNRPAAAIRTGLLAQSADPTRTRAGYERGPVRRRSPSTRNRSGPGRCWSSPRPQRWPCGPAGSASGR